MRLEEPNFGASANNASLVNIMLKSILPHLTVPVLALLFLYCVQAGQPFFFIPILAAFNVLNLIYGEFSEKEIRELLNFYHTTRTARVLKIVNALVLIGVFAAVMRLWDQLPRTFVPTLGLGFVLGIVSGCFLVTLAHELLHGHTRTERGLASILLLITGMPYFATDHLLGHHRYVGLRDDPTTARLGQNFYSYFFSSLRSRWQHSYGKPYPMPPALRRRVFQTNWMMLLLTILLVITIAVFSSQPAILLTLYFTQCFIASLLYELINYIQHYGLERTAQHDPVYAEHSWNCYFKYTNYILFLLPLHSQHHVHQHHNDGRSLMGPRMPYVYFVMVFMALIPPLWFRKMNPMVRVVRQHMFEAKRKLSPVVNDKTSSWPKLAG